jgi:hypothetical protein
VTAQALVLALTGTITCGTSAVETIAELAEELEHSKP